jgi:hypothetical protein
VRTTRLQNLGEATVRRDQAASNGAPEHVEDSDHGRSTHGSAPDDALESALERREAVAELTEDGMSTREIGGVLGVNQSTVARDANASRDPPNVNGNEAPEPEGDAFASLEPDVSALEGHAELAPDLEPESLIADGPTPEPEPPSEEAKRAAHEQRVARLPDDLAPEPARPTRRPSFRTRTPEQAREQRVPMEAFHHWWTRPASRRRGRRRVSGRPAPRVSWASCPWASGR